MHLIQAVEAETRPLEQASFLGHKLKAGGYMESRDHCAYNQTRECFLGLEVAAVDIPYGRLVDLFATLELKSGEGLWMMPFRGVPTMEISVPLDLVYLDGDCRVIEIVESFPTFRISSSSPPAASVLALPAHSIFSSQTQPGDQLVLCVAEDMQRRLERLSDLSGVNGIVQSAVLLRERPLWSGGPGLLELEDRSKGHNSKAQPTHEMVLAEPGVKPAAPPKNWLKRWWSPDPRKAPREPAEGVAAYYWTGAAPEAHSIRDVSSTGLYLVTEERWYPGTLVLMTLQMTDHGEESTERSISVNTRAVRWGNDGVGLQFILQDSKDRPQGQIPAASGADRKELEKFLQRLKKGKK